MRWLRSGTAKSRPLTETLPATETRVARNWMGAVSVGAVTSGGRRAEVHAGMSLKAERLVPHRMAVAAE